MSYGRSGKDTNTADGQYIVWFKAFHMHIQSYTLWPNCKTFSFKCFVMCYHAVRKIHKQLSVN